MLNSKRLLKKGIALSAGLLIGLPAMAATRSTNHNAHSAPHHTQSYKSSTHEHASRKQAKGHEGNRYTGHTSHKKHWKLGQSAPSADRVGEIQTALSKEGFYQGDMNGRWDDSTMSAVKHFQAENALDPTGRLDARTLQKLGLGSDVAGMSAPKPPGD